MPVPYQLVFVQNDKVYIQIDSNVMCQRQKFGVSFESHSHQYEDRAEANSQLRGQTLDEMCLDSLIERQESIRYLVCDDGVVAD